MCNSICDVIQGFFIDFSVDYAFFVKLFLVPWKVHVLVHAVEVDQTLLSLTGPYVWEIDGFVDAAGEWLLCSPSIDFALLHSWKQVFVGEQFIEIHTLSAQLIILLLANFFCMLFNGLDQYFQ